MATTNPPDISHSSSDTSLSFTKIHQGVDFDALIENAMNSSSEMVAGDNKAAAVAADAVDSNENDNYDEDLEKGSVSTTSSNDTYGDDMSLGSDDISVDGGDNISVEEQKTKKRGANYYEPHAPLVNDDESVMEMKNPAPVCQSVSSYVDQLNRRDRSKSRLIRAGVFAILVAVIVGIALAIISTGKKGKSGGNTQLAAPKDQSSPGANTGDESVLDKLFRSAELTIDGTISLSGLFVPDGELEIVKDTLEKTIGGTVSSSLASGQTVTDVTVSSIDSGDGRILFRALQSIALASYTITVKESCRDCDDNKLQSIRKALYQKVVSGLDEAIDTGEFTENLHMQAKISDNSALLSAIAIDGDFEGQAEWLDNGLLPTQPPVPERIPEFDIPESDVPESDIPEFDIPELTTQPSPSPISTSGEIATLIDITSSPVTQAVTVTTPSPTTMAPVTPRPTPSPVTLAPVTRAPFAPPPVEFTPTDPPVFTAPPVEFATDKPTKSPTRRPTLRPTLRPTNRPTPRPSPR